MTSTTRISHATLRTTTNPSPPDLDTFLSLLSTSYLSTPLTTSFITEIDSTPPPYPSKAINPSRLKSHFTLGITAVAKSNILLTFAYPTTSPSQTPLAAALFEPPSFTGIPPSHARKAPGPILTEYRTLARALKTKHLSIPETGPRSWDQPAAPSQSSAGPSEDPWPGDFNKDGGAEIRGFYHLAFIVKNQDADPAQVNLAVRELIAEYQGRAGGEGVPIWLLVSTRSGMEEFMEMGFRVVDEGTVGRGRVDGSGWPRDGDGHAGVTVWAMIWEP